MTAITAEAATLASGKGHKDENFPVASFLLKREHRAPVMAFYHFARAADDVADNAAASADEKLALLDAMRATLAGASDANPESRALRAVLDQHALTPQHGLDLLTAFERDCTVSRYASWDDLMIIAAIRRRRSGGTCLTSMARTPRPGPHPTRCAPRCR